MPRLAALIIRTARFKDAHGLPAILLALPPRSLVFLAILLLCPPDTLPKLADIIPKLLALVPP